MAERNDDDLREKRRRSDHRKTEMLKYLDFDQDLYHEINAVMSHEGYWDKCIKRVQKTRDGTHWVRIHDCRTGFELAWGGPWDPEYRDEVYVYILSLFGYESNIGPLINSSPNKNEDFFADLGKLQNGNEPDFFSELQGLNFFGELETIIVPKKKVPRPKDFWAELEGA